MDNYKVQLPGELTIEIDEEGRATPSASPIEEEPQGKGYGLLPTSYPVDDIFRRQYQVKIEYYSLASSVLIGGVNGRGYRIQDNDRTNYFTIPGAQFFSPFDYPAAFDGVSRNVYRSIDAQLLAAEGIPLDAPDASPSASVNGKGAGARDGYKATVKNLSARITSVDASSSGTTGFNTAVHKVTTEPDYNGEEVTELSLPASGTLRVYLCPEVYLLSISWENLGGGDARRTTTGADLYGRLHVWSGACGGATPMRAPFGLGVFIAVTANPLDMYTVAKRRFDSGGFTDQMSKGEALAWGEVLARGGVTSVAEGVFALADAYLTTPLPVDPGSGFVFRDSVYPHCDEGNDYIQSAPIDILLGSRHLTGAISRAYGANIDLDPTRYIYQGGLLGRFTHSYGDQDKEFWVWAREDIEVYPAGLFSGFGFQTRPRMSGYAVIPVRGMTPFYSYTGDVDSLDKTPYPLPEGADE